jgi:hypothetical protein
MKTRSRNWAWGIVALWLFTAPIVLLLQSWLFEASFLISLASFPLLLLLGNGLLVVLLYLRAWKAAFAFVALTVLVAFLPLKALGHQAWTRVSFVQHRATYEKIVARAPTLPDRGEVEGTAYIKEDRRIAFPRSYGMPDGWSGVVHDPANAMPLNEDTRMIAFGSNVRSCIRIERNWFRCWLD